jgi:hypothetical protein
MEHCNILDKEDVKKQTIEVLRRAKETNREHGFNFCSANGKVVATYIEGGEKDSVGIKNICPVGAKVIGALHIHTRPSLSKDTIPSPTDIQKSIVENMAFFCIGTNINGQGVVRCFNKEDLESEMNNILKKTKLEKLGLKTEDIDKSTRLITGRMTMYKDYLNEHSCQRIMSENIHREII